VRGEPHEVAFFIGLHKPPLKEPIMQSKTGFARILVLSLLLLLAFTACGGGDGGGGGAPPPPVLTVTKPGSGSGPVTSSPAGIDCGALCSASFAPGTEVTITAGPPTNGSTFAGWAVVVPEQVPAS